MRLTRKAHPRSSAAEAGVAPGLLPSPFLVSFFCSAKFVGSEYSPRLACAAEDVGALAAARGPGALDQRRAAVFWNEAFGSFELSAL
jgi:hypothetical protein